jgi:FMN reductase
VLVVGIGGTTRNRGLTERSLARTLAALEVRGIETVAFYGDFLMSLPFYGAEPRVCANGQRLVDACRNATALVLVSPGYHGTISGLVKNAIDYLEELRDDDPPYLDGKPVGCVAAAGGWQACANTLRALRDVAHSLRGIPAPLGVCVCAKDDAGDDRLDALAGQLLELSTAMQATRGAGLMRL